MTSLVSPVRCRQTTQQSDGRSIKRKTMIDMDPAATSASDKQTVCRNDDADVMFLAYNRGAQSSNKNSPGLGTNEGARSGAEMEASGAGNYEVGAYSVGFTGVDSNGEDDTSAGAHGAVVSSAGAQSGAESQIDQSFADDSCISVSDATLPSITHEGDSQDLFNLESVTGWQEDEENWTNTTESTSDDAEVLTDEVLRRMNDLVAAFDMDEPEDINTAVSVPIVIAPEPGTEVEYKDTPDISPIVIEPIPNPIRTAPCQTQTPQISTTAVYQTPQTGLTAPYQNPQTSLTAPYQTPQTSLTAPYQTPQTGLTAPYQTPQTSLTAHYHTAQTNTNAPYQPGTAQNLPMTANQYYPPTYQPGQLQGMYPNTSSYPGMAHSGSSHQRPNCLQQPPVRYNSGNFPQVLYRLNSQGPFPANPSIQGIRPLNQDYFRLPPYTGMPAQGSASNLWIPNPPSYDSQTLPYQSHSQSTVGQSQGQSSLNGGWLGGSAQNGTPGNGLSYGLGQKRKRTSNSNSDDQRRQRQRTGDVLRDSTNNMSGQAGTTLSTVSSVQGLHNTSIAPMQTSVSTQGNPTQIDEITVETLEGLIGTVIQNIMMQNEINPQSSMVPASAELEMQGDPSFGRGKSPSLLTYVCKICMASFNSKSGHNRHSLTLHKAESVNQIVEDFKKRRGFTCLHCPKRFLEEDDIIHHVAVHLLPWVVPRSSETAAPENMVMEPTGQGKSAVGRLGLWKTSVEKQPTGKTYHCPFCVKTLSKMCGIAVHLKAQHYKKVLGPKGNPGFQCPLCNFFSASSKGMLSHIFEKHGVKVTDRTISGTYVTQSSSAIIPGVSCGVGTVAEGNEQGIGARTEVQSPNTLLLRRGSCGAWAVHSPEPGSFPNDLTLTVNIQQPTSDVSSNQTESLSAPQLLLSNQHPKPQSSPAGMSENADSSEVISLGVPPGVNRMIAQDESLPQDSTILKRLLDQNDEEAEQNSEKDLNTNKEADHSNVLDNCDTQQSQLVLPSVPASEGQTTEPASSDSPQDKPTSQSHQVEVKTEPCDDPNAQALSDNEHIVKTTNELAFNILGTLTTCSVQGVRAPEDRAETAPSESGQDTEQCANSSARVSADSEHSAEGTNQEEISHSSGTPVTSPSIQEVSKLANVSKDLSDTPTDPENSIESVSRREDADVGDINCESTTTPIAPSGENVIAERCTSGVVARGPLKKRHFCHKCGRGFAMVGAYEVHMMKAHGTNFTKSAARVAKKRTKEEITEQVDSKTLVEKPTNSQDNNNTCNICNKYFVFPGMLRLHKKFHDVKPASRLFCSQDVEGDQVEVIEASDTEDGGDAEDTETRLLDLQQSHAENPSSAAAVHSDLTSQPEVPNTLHCPACVSSFTDGRALIQHLKVHCRDQTLLNQACFCRVCEEILPCISAMIPHMSAHLHVRRKQKMMNSKPWPSKCSVLVGRAPRVNKMHKKSKSKFQNLSCPVCHKTFRDGRIIIHIKMHMNDSSCRNRSLDCSLCSQVSTNISAFVLHLRMHMALSKVYTQCPLCTKGLPRRRLMKHIFAFHEEKYAYVLNNSPQADSIIIEHKRSLRWEAMGPKVSAIKNIVQKPALASKNPLGPLNKVNKQSSVKKSARPEATEDFQEYQKSRSKLGSLGCPVCGQSWRVGPMFIGHIKRHMKDGNCNTKNLECAFCDKISHSLSAYMLHVKLHMKRIGAYLSCCPYCDKNVQNQRMAKHVSFFHKDKYHEVLKNVPQGAPITGDMFTEFEDSVGIERMPLLQDDSVPMETMPALEDLVPWDNVAGKDGLVSVESMPALEDSVPRDNVPAKEDLVLMETMPALENSVAIKVMQIPDNCVVIQNGEGQHADDDAVREGLSVREKPLTQEENGTTVNTTQRKEPGSGAAGRESNLKVRSLLQEESHVNSHHCEESSSGHSSCLGEETKVTETQNSPTANAISALFFFDGVNATDGETHLESTFNDSAALEDASPESWSEQLHHPDMSDKDNAKISSYQSTFKDITCPICGDISPDGRSFMPHLKSHCAFSNIQYGDLNCPHCEDVFQSVHLLMQHVRLHFSLKGNRCLFCRKFQAMTRFCEHLRDCHKEIELEKVFPFSDPNSPVMSIEGVRSSLMVNPPVQGSTSGGVNVMDWEIHPGSTVSDREKDSCSFSVARKDARPESRSEQLIQADTYHKDNANISSYEGTFKDLTCPICGDRFQDGRAFIPHLQNHSKDCNAHYEDLNCPYCEDVFQSVHLFTQHVQLHYALKSSKCFVCKKKQSRTRFLEHLRDCHQEIELEKIFPFSDPNSPVMPRQGVRSALMEKLPVQSNMSGGLAVTNGETHTGSIVSDREELGRSFGFAVEDARPESRSEQLNQPRPYHKDNANISSYESTFKDITCPICDDKFKDGRAFIPHLQNHSVDHNVQYGDLNCPHCEDVFQSVHLFIQHVRLHFALKCTQCFICRKSQARTTFLEHLRDCHKEIELEKVFPFSDLNSPVMPRQGVRSALMEKLPAQSNMSGGLYVTNGETHTGSVVSDGEELGHSFSIADEDARPESRSEHLNQPKPYHKDNAIISSYESTFKDLTCPICGDKFKDGRAFIPHLQNHSEHYNVQYGDLKCPHCGDVFQSVHLFIQHVRLHFSLKRSRCFFCKKFHAMTRFCEHLRVCHKEIELEKVFPFSDPNSPVTSMRELKSTWNMKPPAQVEAQDEHPTENIVPHLTTGGSALADDSAGIGNGSGEIDAGTDDSLVSDSDKSSDLLGECEDETPERLPHLVIKLPGLISKLHRHVEDIQEEEEEEEEKKNEPCQEKPAPAERPVGVYGEHEDGACSTTTGYSSDGEETSPGLSDIPIKTEPTEAEENVRPGPEHAVEPEEPAEPATLDPSEMVHQGVDPIENTDYGLQQDPSGSCTRTNHFVHESKFHIVPKTPGTHEPRKFNIIPLKKERKHQDVVTVKKFKVVEKRHKCLVCGRAFAMAKNLYYHSWMHTGEKLVQCNICGKKFSRPDTLILHMRYHNNTLPHRCQFCVKGYNRPSELAKHIRIRHKDQVNSDTKDFKGFLGQNIQRWFPQKQCFSEKLAFSPPPSITQQNHLSSSPQLSSPQFILYPEITTVSPSVNMDTSALPSPGNNSNLNYNNSYSSQSSNTLNVNNQLSMLQAVCSPNWKPPLPSAQPLQELQSNMY